MRELCYFAHPLGEFRGDGTCFTREMNVRHAMRLEGQIAARLGDEVVLWSPWLPVAFVPRMETAAMDFCRSAIRISDSLAVVCLPKPFGEIQRGHDRILRVSFGEMQEIETARSEGKPIHFFGWGGRLLSLEWGGTRGGTAVEVFTSEETLGPVLARGNA